MVLFPRADFGRVLADEDRPKFAESLDDSKSPVVQSPVSFDCLFVLMSLRNTENVLALLEFGATAV